MASQNDQNHYAAVIADLEVKRDELDRMIKNLRQMGGLSTAQKEVLSTEAKSENEVAAIGGDNPLLGMKVHDGVKVILANKRKPMSPAELVEALEAGGIILTGNKTNSVGSILNRRQKQVGDIVSPQRGMWGLKEWYPGRSFGKRQDEKDEASERNLPGMPIVPALVIPRQSSD